MKSLTILSHDKEKAIKEFCNFAVDLSFTVKKNDHSLILSNGSNEILLNSDETESSCVLLSSDQKEVHHQSVESAKCLIISENKMKFSEYEKIPKITYGHDKENTIMLSNDDENICLTLNHQIKSADGYTIEPCEYNIKPSKKYDNLSGFCACAIMLGMV